jgi:hypothetical protein
MTSARPGSARRPIARPERDLVAALRAELAAIDPARPCDRAAEAVALAGRGRSRDVGLARLAHRLATGAEPPGDTAGLDVAGRDAAGRGVASPDAVAGGSATVGFAWAAAPEHCRTAWLRGTFLARGSLSLAAGRTHLEFLVPVGEGVELADRLADGGLPTIVRTRRGRDVVISKNTETVGTFLRRIGAGAALLEVEARQVSRALRGELNRVLNAESANLGRAVAAAGRQLAAIDALSADGRLGEQPYVVRLVADARREAPEATLAELAELAGVHRSAAQRALERLEWLALHDPDGAADRPVA